MHLRPHERLRELREQKGFKGQKHFCAHAAKLGLPIKVRRYGAIERGEVRPTLEEIAQICMVMDISADSWLLGRTNKIDMTRLTDREVRVVRDLISGLISLR